MEVGALCPCGCFNGCMVSQHSQKSDPGCSKHVGSVLGEGKLFSANCGKMNMTLRGYLYETILYKSFSN